MILNNKDINILTLTMKIMELRNRFCRYGIMTAEEYQKARTSAMDQPLVYNPETLDEDGMYTIFEGYGNTNRYHTDMFVRFFTGDTRDEDFIEVAVPVVFEEDCKACDGENCNECPSIGYYQLYLIGRDGSIAEDIDMDEHDECCCDCDCCDCCPQDNAEDAKTVAAIMHCRETGAHDLCKCECGEEHCFVECGPNPDETCHLNENGRCHCPHNRCCGCDCECDPDDDDE